MLVSLWGHATYRLRYFMKSRKVPSENVKVWELFWVVYDVAQATFEKMYEQFTLGNKVMRSRKLRL